MQSAGVLVLCICDSIELIWAVFVCLFVWLFYFFFFFFFSVWAFLYSISQHCWAHPEIFRHVWHVTRWLFIVFPQAKTTTTF